MLIGFLEQVGHRSSLDCLVVCVPAFSGHFQQSEETLQTLKGQGLDFSVPDSKSRNIPEVVFVRRGQLGFWQFGKGGTVG
jgi:hypothetical protein